MEDDESKPLLAASPTSSPSRNGASASHELSGDRTRGNSPRGAPPTKEHPSSSYSTTPPPAAAAGSPVPSSSTTPPPAAAAGTPVPSSSPSPPLAAAAGTPVPSSSPSPRTAAGVSEDRPAFDKIASRPLPVGASSNGNANKEGSGVSENSPPRQTPTLPSLSLPNGQGRVLVGNGASLSGGVCWDLSGKMRRAPSHLPVSAPPGLRETLRRQGARLDSVGVEKLIELFGFSLFGSLSLLPFTADRVKDDSNITQTHRIILVLSFGLIWVLASVGVLCGLHGKSDFEQVVCRLTACLGFLGLTLLVILHLLWMLPSGTFANVFIYACGIAAIILHILSWAMSGEETVEEVTAPASEQK